MLALNKQKKYLTKSIVREFINKSLHAHKCICFAPEYVWILIMHGMKIISLMQRVCSLRRFWSRIYTFINILNLMSPCLFISVRIAFYYMFMTPKVIDLDYIVNFELYLLSNVSHLNYLN